MIGKLLLILDLIFIYFQNRVVCYSTNLRGYDVVGVA